MNNRQEGIWGRASTTTLFSFISTLGILLLTPLLVFFFYIACVEFEGSLANTAEAFVNQSWADLAALLPPFEIKAFFLLAGWIIFQGILYLFLPDQIHKAVPIYRGGIQQGSVTPGGETLSYQINGLQSWLISHVLFLACSFGLGLFSPTILADLWGPLLWVVNIFGYCLAWFVFIKAYIAPTSLLDRKFSGNFLYDFYMGIEFNPRIKNFDFKLFFNGRPGIIAWSLINISFAAKQYALYGTVTNGMILVNMLQVIYILDFFWHEAWYLKTIDICHDHFGWMLAWGDSVWLPYMYTLQGLYLLYHPATLSKSAALIIFFLGLAGYAIFRSANYQKDIFRNSKHPPKIWGENPRWIDCAYTTLQGETKKSRLLTTGWWGKARHFNYTGDLILSLAYCLSCGFDNLLPYFYVIYMTILLVHRCYRDEHRCYHKYGEGWTNYCREVPYRLIPGLF